MDKTSSPEFIPFNTDESSDSAFRLTGPLKELVAADPGIRSHIEARIEAEVRTRLEMILGRERSAALEAARAEGLEQGRAEALARWKEERVALAAVLEEVSRKVIEEKAALLRSHEEAWGRALEHVLRRFLVPRAESVASDLRAWLSESVAVFPAEAKIVARLAACDYDRLPEGFALPSGRSWEIVKDADLAPGEIRCECDAGGIVFFPVAQLERLHSLAARSFEEKASAKAASIKLDAGPLNAGCPSAPVEGSA